MFDRPISFLEKLRIGKREHGFFGTKEVEVEINSHDKARVTALRETVLALRVHEENPDQADIIDSKYPLSPKIQLSEDRQYKVVRLAKDSQLDLYRTSFIVVGTDNEQVRWTPSLYGVQDDLFSDFCIRTLEESVFSEQ
jgi:hypothetical protein